MQGQNIKAGMAKADAPADSTKVASNELPAMDPLEEIKKRNASAWSMPNR
jgi:hypothetical protein